MLTSPKDIWGAALGELQLRVTRPNYDTWLKDTRGLAFDNGVFVIGAANIFVAEWLNSRLASLVTETLTRITGSEVRAQFVVSSRPQASPARMLQLNSNYTFDSFTVNAGNRTAYSAALTASQRPGAAFNPLFIHASPGLGKTHLLHSVAHATSANGTATVTTSAEGFTTEFFLALRAKNMPAFHHKYRSTRVLLVDDVQFFEGKEQTQECFCHIFDELYHAHSQIIVTSDRIPKAMSFLAPKLASRLECGLMTGIQPPDYETRLAILRAKTGKAGVEIQPGVLERLAANICNNIRELEGAVNQLAAYVRDNKVSPDVHVADQVLRELGNSSAAKALAPGQVVESVASYFRVAAELLRSPRRDQKITLIRDVAVYLLRAQGVTLTEIGRQLGGRNHATILQGWRKVNAQLDTNPQLQQDIATLRSQLQPQYPPA